VLSHVILVLLLLHEHVHVWMYALHITNTNSVSVANCTHSWLRFSSATRSCSIEKTIRYSSVKRSRLKELQQIVFKFITQWDVLCKTCSSDLKSCNLLYRFSSLLL
jgi:hypothetical protein